MIREKVYKMLKDQGAKEFTEKSGDTMLEDDLGFDSLDIVEMVMTAEEEFDIDITDDEVEKLKTVADMVNVVEKKEKEKEKQT